MCKQAIGPDVILDGHKVYEPQTLNTRLPACLRDENDSLRLPPRINEYRSLVPDTYYTHPGGV